MHWGKILTIAVSLSLFSCAGDKKNNSIKKDETGVLGEIPLDEDFARLVIVDSLGVTGADGVISFPLDKQTSIFMMGDSFLSPVNEGKRDVDSKMINNTFIKVDKKAGTHKSYFKGTLDNPESLLVPDHGNPKEYYWPGHAFVHNGMVHTFMSRFIPVDYGWGFEFSGTDYLRLDKDSFRVISQEDFPYSNGNDVHYGHSILLEKDYVYLYGSRSVNETTSLHVARARMDEAANKLVDFEFYTDGQWTLELEKSSPLEGIEKDVPEQFSVFKYGEKYILVMQERGLIAGNIFSYISDSPVGPWSNEQLLFHTKEQYNSGDQVFTYNAMAHPQYIENNKLLISYCVNSFEVPKIHEVDVEYYRPGFFWVPLDKILK